MLVFDKVSVEQTVSRLKQYCVLLWCLSLAAVAGAEERWVVLGDSISAGYGIPVEQGWVQLIQDKVTAKGRSVTVSNESISGDTSAGGLARLPEILDRIKPTKVIIELGGNDGLRGLSPVAMERNLTDMVLLCQSRGIEVVLLGMKIPPNYGAKYSAMFESAYANIARAHGVDLLPFFLEGVGGFDALMQSDRIHPNVAAQPVLANNAWKILGKPPEHKQ